MGGEGEDEDEEGETDEGEVASSTKRADSVLMIDSEYNFVSELLVSSKVLPLLLPLLLLLLLFGNAT